MEQEERLQSEVRHWKAIAIALADEADPNWRDFSLRDWPYENEHWQEVRRAVEDGIIGNDEGHRQAYETALAASRA